MQSGLNKMKQSLDAFSYRAQRYLAYYNRIWQQRMDEMSRRSAEYWQAVANRFEEMRPYWDNAFATVQAKIEGKPTRSHSKAHALKYYLQIRFNFN